MATAAADPAPAEVITCARGSAALPAAQTPGTLVSPSAVHQREPRLVPLAAQAGEQAVGVGDGGGPDEYRGPRDYPAVGERDAGQLVVLDDQPGDLTGDDRDPPAVQLAPLGRGQLAGAGEEDDIGGPLPDQQGVLD